MVDIPVLIIQIAVIQMIVNFMNSAMSISISSFLPTSTFTQNFEFSEFIFRNKNPLKNGFKNQEKIIKITNPTVESSD